MDLSLAPKLAALLIPLTAIALPVIIIFVVLYFRERQREQLYDTVKHFADRGMPVPRELLDPPRQPTAEVFGTARFRAITLIGAGVGVALMFWGLNLQFLMGIGALLGCVGAAQLIAVRLDRSDRAVPPTVADDGQLR